MMSPETFYARLRTWDVSLPDFSSLTPDQQGRLSECARELRELVDLAGTERAVSLLHRVLAGEVTRGELQAMVGPK